MKIEKGVQPNYFKAIAGGRKRFEVRLANFKCKPGDILVLKEEKRGTKKYTGRKQECEVLYKFNTKDIEKFHSKKDIDKYGLLVLAIRKTSFLEPRIRPEYRQKLDKAIKGRHLFRDEMERAVKQ